VEKEAAASIMEAEVAAAMEDNEEVSEEAGGASRTTEAREEQGGDQGVDQRDDDEAGTGGIQQDALLPGTADLESKEEAREEVGGAGSTAGALQELCGEQGLAKYANICLGLTDIAGKFHIVSDSLTLCHTCMHAHTHHARLG
jgi:hypothetical protein